MEPNKSLARAGYLIAALLIVLPLFDASMSVWPPHLGDERWRYGAVGALSNLTLVPLLGFFMALVIASVVDHRRVRRVLGVLCGIFAVVLAALAVLFILDYFQTRTIVKPAFQHAMGLATGTALVKHILSIIALTLLSRAGFAGPRPAVRRKVVITEPTATPLMPVSGTVRAE